jgi:glyoxalase family protein
MRIGGFHHVTALAGDAQRNLDFYRKTLGLRLVKHTVNYDDPGTHHFYYGDAAGLPGSLLTFFPWGRVRGGRKGSGAVVSITVAVPDPPVPPPAEPDGIPIEFVAGEKAAIRSVTILESDRDAAVRLLGGVLGFEPVDALRFQVAPEQHIEIAHDPAAPPARMAGGMVHHIAFRVAGEAELLAWRARLIEAGWRASQVRDRRYFRSVYFKHAGGTLFELATDGPGFRIDEPPDALGASLCLPPWLEPHREEIAARLAPVSL